MPISFDIPERFADVVALGKVVRFGAVLKEVETGRIVGHLQETGALYDMLGRLPSLPLNPFSAINAVSGVVANVQLHRLDSKVEQTLQLVQDLKSMQVASLTLAGLGLGVSVATFAYLKHRMDKVELRLDGIQAGQQKLLDEQRRAELERLETDLDAQLSHAEEAWHHGDGGQRAWSRVADKLNDMVYKYPKHIQRELEVGHIQDPQLLMYLMERFRVLGATRVECLILTGELHTALDFAQRFAENTQKMLARVTPLQFVDRGQAHRPAFSQALHRGRRFAAQLRDFHDVSASKPMLIADFIAHRVDGRDYIRQMKAEKKRELVAVSF